MLWPSRFMRRTNCHRPWRNSTSTPAVGSSSTITGGLGIGADQSGDDVDQRGLAGAVRPEQPEELALIDLEADAGKGAQHAEALLDLMDFYGFQEAGSRRSTPYRRAMVRSDSGRLVKTS